MIPNDAPSLAPPSSKLSLESSWAIAAWLLRTSITAGWVTIWPADPNVIGTAENDPKPAASRRTLPLPDRLVTVLRSAKRRQAAERLALGVSYGGGVYVVSNEAGEPYSPAVLSRYWRDAVKAAKVRHIKLHAARHTCATLMHLEGVPVAVIAAWIGHKDASLTLRLYAHSQDDALKVAGASLNRVVTTS